MILRNIIVDIGSGNHMSYEIKALPAQIESIQDKHDREILNLPFKGVNADSPD